MQTLIETLTIKMPTGKKKHYLIIKEGNKKVVITINENKLNELLEITTKQEELPFIN